MLFLAIMKLLLHIYIYFYWTIFSTFSPLCNSESRANNEMTEQKMAPSTTTGMPIVEMATVESKESKLRILFLGPPFFTVDVGS